MALVYAHSLALSNNSFPPYLTLFPSNSISLITAFAQTKKMMYNNPALLHSILSHFAESIGVYACHQVAFLPIEPRSPLLYY